MDLQNTPGLPSVLLELPMENARVVMGCTEHHIELPSMLSGECLHGPFGKAVCRKSCSGAPYFAFDCAFTKTPLLEELRLTVYLVRVRWLSEVKQAIEDSYGRFSSS